jgi:hypothetical protein
MITGENTSKYIALGKVPFFGALLWSAAQAVKPAGLQQLLYYTCSYSALAAAWPVLK